MSSRLLTVIAVVVLVAGLASLPANATILTFNSSDGFTSNASFATYGVNVASASQGGFTYYQEGEGWTPDVSVSFVSNSGLIQWYQDAVWTGVAYQDARYMIFTPAAGVSVKINDVDLQSYGGSNASLFQVISLDQDGYQDQVLMPVISSSTPIASGPGHTRFAVDYTGAPGQVIALLLSGTGNNTGYDRIRFSQVVPEPASLSLLGLSGLAMLRRTRR